MRYAVWGQCHRGSYIPVVHCGSLRQAARVLSMEEVSYAEALQAGACKSAMMAGAAAAATLEEASLHRALASGSPPHGATSPPVEPQGLRSACHPARG